MKVKFTVSRIQRLSDKQRIREMRNSVNENIPRMDICYNFQRH